MKTLAEMALLGQVEPLSPDQIETVEPMDLTPFIQKINAELIEKKAKGEVLTIHMKLEWPTKMLKEAYEKMGWDIRMRGAVGTILSYEFTQTPKNDQ